MQTPPKSAPLENIQAFSKGEAPGPFTVARTRAVPAEDIKSMEPTRSRLDFAGDDKMGDAVTTITTTDVDKLEAQLGYFRSMRQEAESLVARLQGGMGQPSPEESPEPPAARRSAADRESIEDVMNAYDDEDDDEGDDADASNVFDGVNHLNDSSINDSLNLDDSMAMAAQLANLQAKQKQLAALGAQLEQLRAAQAAQDTSADDEEDRAVSPDNDDDLDEEDDDDQSDEVDDDDGDDAMDQLRAALAIDNGANIETFVPPELAHELVQLQKKREMVESMRSQLAELRASAAAAEVEAEAREQAAALTQSAPVATNTVPGVADANDESESAMTKQLYEKFKMLQSMQQRLADLKEQQRQLLDAQAMAQDESDAQDGNDGSSNNDNDDGEPLQLGADNDNELSDRLGQLQMLQNHLASLSNNQAVSAPVTAAAPATANDDNDPRQELFAKIQRLQQLQARLAMLQAQQERMGSEAEVGDSHYEDSGDDGVPREDESDNGDESEDGQQDEGDETEDDREAQEHITAQLERLRFLQSRLAEIEQARQQASYLDDTLGYDDADDASYPGNETRGDEEEEEEDLPQALEDDDRAAKLERLQFLQARLAEIERLAAGGGGADDQPEEESGVTLPDLPADLDPAVCEQLVRMHELQAQLAQLQKQKRDLDALQASMGDPGSRGVSVTEDVDDDALVAGYGDPQQLAELQMLKERKEELLRMRNALQAVRDSQTGEDGGTHTHQGDDDHASSEDSNEDDFDLDSTMASYHRGASNEADNDEAALTRLQEQLRQLQEVKHKMELAKKMMVGNDANESLSQMPSEAQEAELKRRKRIVSTLREEFEGIQLDGAEWADEYATRTSSRADTESASQAGHMRTLLEHVRALPGPAVFRNDDLNSARSTDGSTVSPLRSDVAGAPPHPVADPTGMSSTPVRRLVGMLDELAQHQTIIDRMNRLQAGGNVPVSSGTPATSHQAPSTLLPLPEDEELEVISHVREYSPAGGPFKDVMGSFQAVQASMDAMMEEGTMSQPPSVNSEWAEARDAETSFQNLKLATLYAESLPPSYREEFLRIFFHFSRDPATASAAFQLSFDTFQPPVSDDELAAAAHEMGDTEYSPVYRSKRMAAPSDKSASVSVLFDDHELAARRQPETPADLMTFEEAKADIYNQVAFLIAQNEDHPTFLIEFFQTAQQIVSDEHRRGCLAAMLAVLEAHDNIDDGNRRNVDDNLTFSDGTRARPPSSEHRNRSYDYEEAVMDGVEVPTDDDDTFDPTVSQTMSFLDAAGGANDSTVSKGLNDSTTEDLLISEFQAEIVGNKTIVLEVSQFLGEQDGKSKFTAALADKIVSMVTAAMQRVSIDEDFSPVGESLDQLAIGLSKSLKKHVGLTVAAATEPLLGDVQDIVFDVMVFNKVIKQVDRSYVDEISELQTRRNDIGANVDQLQKFREDDLGRLFRKRRELLHKMRLDAERDSDVLDNARDNDFAAEFDPPSDGPPASSSAPKAKTTQVQVQLTPAEAQGIDSDDNDEDDTESNGAVTLEDLPDEINLGSNIAALEYLQSHHGLVA